MLLVVLEMAFHICVIVKVVNNWNVEKKGKPEEKAKTWRLERAAEKVTSIVQLVTELVIGMISVAVNPPCQALEMDAAVEHDPGVEVVVAAVVVVGGAVVVATVVVVAIVVGAVVVVGATVVVTIVR